MNQAKPRRGALRRWLDEPGVFLKWVAFACVIFGAANPGKAYLAALMFGFFDALGYRLQDYHMNANLTSMIPYVITVVMMVYVVVRSQQKKKRAVTRVLPG